MRNARHRNLLVRNYQQRVFPPRALRYSTFGDQRLRCSSGNEEVIFSGIQPTGVPHLGNYLGALQRWVQLQNEDTTAKRFLYSIVDLHAITTQQNAEQIRQKKRETLATLLSIGLDPTRCTIFYQSAVRDHCLVISVILSC